MTEREKYTPSDEYVRESYMEARERDLDEVSARYGHEFDAWLAAHDRALREQINGTHVREVVFDGHSAVPGTPALVLEDFGLTVHLWDGTFTRDLGDGRAGWLSATVETGRWMMTVRHGETLRVLVDQTGRATGIVVPVDYGEDQ